MAKRVAAILVDAGYVWKQIAKAVGREHRRDADLVGYGVPLIEALVEEAEGDEIAVLRTYWYDAAIDRNPNVQQRAIGRTARVKLRLGILNHGKQKGVDRLIQRDILALASNRAVSDIIVLTGDQDMEEELDAAGQHGCLLHVWGISDRDQRDGVSGRLLWVADEWKVFPAHWAETFVQSPGGNQEGIPLASDAALDALRERLLVGMGGASAFEPRALEESGWSATQYVMVGREAYDSLKEQHRADWAGKRAEVAHNSWVLRNGQKVRSIPGGVDTELMDIAEAVFGKKLTTSDSRIEVRNGFWERFDEDVDW